ncbi:PQQ-dependent sugar dehydrogenase [Luteolibacter sp. LG18]|uniref:PQQ-dependent sugar dehydrogenase n=1 Tax=Luteolibacter sp. LG18 TaxID=2819286 RepID=UPI002B28208A|nr:hypothetical protein llg_27620 [Luteolibacter sp. LG18]
MNRTHPLLASALLALPSASAGGAPASDLSAPVAEGLHDPMAMAVTPDQKLIVIEREGRILRVHPLTGGTFEIGQLDVSTLHAKDSNSPSAREEGLLGIALDPKFEKNQRLYLHYSVPRTPRNRLSRFTLKNGVLDPASELVMLEIPIERDKKVCHLAGSMAFGPDGLLYLAIGDNTNPFESGGYAPLDNRPGREHFDAERSAGNTNDLRGKILRIRPTETGYEIPPGNLFPPGTPKTRPEIYVMGCRNPFRISIDPRKGTLYWGEVGPDANGDGNRGSRGYDEVNQARKAGNFGWPFVIADNRTYPVMDFATGKPGDMTDAAAPKNPGDRNTGLATLPPAQPAFIWYPYAASQEFPALGSGSRNAMAGPVFYYDSHRKWNLLPAEDDHTLLNYDWARGKIWKARLNPDESLKSVEPFVEKLVHPIDLKPAADGTLWVLEYGTNWYFNKDGRIRALRPATGNRPPELTAAANTDGTFTAQPPVDPDGDKVAFRWFLTTGTDEKDLGQALTVSVKPGAGTELRAVAVDAKGALAVKRFPLTHEKALPALALELPGQPKSLSPSTALRYKVTAPVPSEAKDVSVKVRYIPPTGHDAGGPDFSTAIRELVTKRSCLACHQVDQASVGPRYLDVALRLHSRPDAVDYLKGRVLKGSTGDWGEVPMPPQAIGEDEADTIVRAILGLADGMAAVKGNLEGEITLPALTPDLPAGGEWEISAEAGGHLPAKLRLPSR